jgi:V/A-type H+-transporting ATPase subunit E
MSKLEEILQQEAGGEIDAILAEAESRAGKIVSEAESKAKDLLAEHRKRAEAKARAAIEQARSAADLRVSIARIQAKGEVMDQVRQKVMSALEKTPSQQGYDKVLLALAEEALKVAEEAEAVVVHPDDREKLADWAKQKELEVKADPELRLGVLIISRSGRKLENTLPERLHRAWDTLATEVTGLLWEEDKRVD